jgi:hypothetical protein
MLTSMTIPKDPGRGDLDDDRMRTRLPTAIASTILSCELVSLVLASVFDSWVDASCFNSLGPLMTAFQT